MILFEGYHALMDHRSTEHPSNKICNKIPQCTGWVNGRKCWYLHPSEKSVTKNIENTPPTQDREFDCKRCGELFESKNKFMDHYTTKHTSHIVCRDWLKNNCKRFKCWYRHDQMEARKERLVEQRVPTSQDFMAVLPPPQPPLQRQPAAHLQSQDPARSQTEIQKIIGQMAMRMNTLELGISESRNQMHVLQQMLATSQI